MSNDLDRKILRYCYNMPWPVDVSEEDLIDRFSGNTRFGEQSIELRVDKLRERGLLEAGSNYTCTTEGVQVLSNYESIETTEKLREQEMRASAVESIFTIALLIFAGVQASSLVNIEYVVLAVGSIILWALLIGGKNIIEVTRLSLSEWRDFIAFYLDKYSFNRAS